MKNIKVASELLKLAKALSEDDEVEASYMPTHTFKKPKKSSDASEMVYTDDTSKVASELTRIARDLMARDVDFSEVKKKLKAIGFDARIKSMSWGPHLVLVDAEGNKDTGNVYSVESLAKWKPAHDIIREFANDNVMYKGMKVIGFKK